MKNRKVGGLIINQIIKELFGSKTAKQVSEKVIKYKIHKRAEQKFTDLTAAGKYGPH